MNTYIKTIPHVEKKPLSIEREYTLQGYEMILIDGVRYDADYFRTFARPDEGVLYAVRSHDDTVVLTVIRNLDEARKFFDEVVAPHRDDMEDQDAI